MSIRAEHLQSARLPQKAFAAPLEGQASQRRLGTLPWVLDDIVYHQNGGVTAIFTLDRLGQLRNIHL